MKAVLQRVSRSQVTIDGEVVGQTGPGLVALVGIHRDDTEAEARKLADRVVGMRVFNDAEGKINLNLMDACGETGAPNLLAISNFTIYGDPWASRRPGFTSAAPYAVGEELMAVFCTECERLGARVAQGRFGADMQVELVNDGPVTLIAEVVPAKVPN